ncbi:hypothetical protein [Polyangium sp. y55x31]|uniref:hypothetical protein n=1 Tax=Polyangium sp. y55x31 TaxID=3042688 RepID=UPI0024823292|nr:hypothetical protein [Polyangium sp. y55x31]MDI1483566.1 hypothetical protein [Polyangium sp. y55x31]
MSKKALTMSLVRPSKPEPKPEPKAEPKLEPKEVADATSAEVEPKPAPQPAPKPVVRPSAAAARLEAGTKRIVVDVVPAVHKQVKVRSVEYPGGIKEYILRLLEADGVDMSAQPDFIPRPKAGLVSE